MQGREEWKAKVTRNRIPKEWLSGNDRSNDWMGDQREAKKNRNQANRQNGMWRG